MLAVGGLLGLIALVLAIGSRSPGAPATGMPRAAGLARIEALPLQAQGLISTAIAADDSAFAARRLPDGGFGMAGGGLRAAVGRGGLRVSTAGGSLSLALTAIGRGRVQGVGGVGPASAPVARGNRVTIDHAGVAEWYASGPLGIEQGFTVERRPAGSRGPLTVVLGVGGSLAARGAGSGAVFTSATGRSVLRYGGLSALDATGRALPASLTVARGRLLLTINDRGARYPLRVDPFIEQQKIQAPSDTIGESALGTSSAISSDGNTVLIGGDQDNGGIGAAWVFVRTGSKWTEQTKIVPADLINVQASNPDVPAPAIGTSVALSADGNTALIGGPGDGANSSAPNALYGAVWVYTRTGTSWTEQQKIVVDYNDNGDEIAYGAFGYAVALSSNGNIALIGGENDGPPNSGAAWIFARSGTGSKFTEQTKIIAPDETADGSGGAVHANFGWSVALSGDGTTALIGGPLDGANYDVGAAWVYTGSGSSWTEQAKLVPGDGVPIPSFSGGGGFGSPLALSADGDTALIGATGDGNNTGAAWIYTRSGATWTEQKKIVPSNETGSANFGSGVALSADGNTALIGGDGDNGGDGALWVYGRSGSSWSQLQKIAPADENGTSSFGGTASLSADGSTAVVGGISDGAAGSIWAYSSSSGGGGGGGGGGAKPTCTLTAHGDKLNVPKSKHGKKARPAAGTFTLGATCDQAVDATLAGSVTEVVAAKHDKKKATKTVGLRSVNAKLSANTAGKLAIDVPASVTGALENGAKVSAAFTLTATNAAGKATESVKVPHLKL